MTLIAELQYDYVDEPFGDFTPCSIVLLKFLGGKAESFAAGFHSFKYAIDFYSERSSTDAQIAHKYLEFGGFQKINAFESTENGRTIIKEIYRNNNPEKSRIFGDKFSPTVKYRGN